MNVSGDESKTFSGSGSSSPIESVTLGSTVVGDGVDGSFGGGREDVAWDVEGFDEGSDVEDMDGSGFGHGGGVVRDVDGREGGGVERERLSSDSVDGSNVRDGSVLQESVVVDIVRAFRLGVGLVWRRGRGREVRQKGRKRERDERGGSSSPSSC